MEISSLLEDYEKFCDLPKSTNRVDLSHIPITPAALIPTIYYAKSNSIPPILPREYNARNHLKRILGLSEKNVYSFDEVQFNIVDINDNNEQKAETLSNADELVWNLLFEKEREYEQYGGVNTLRYVVGEILSNVDQNSEASHVYNYSKIYSKRKFLDIGILDNGISIPGKYEKSRPEFADKDINPYEFENDCEALYKAINGISTKEGFKRAMEGISSYEDIYLNDWIGYGLNTSIRLVTEGLGGSFLIASREGVCHLTKKEKSFIKVKKENILNGTFVCIRFKRAKLKKHDFMDYVAYHKPINGFKGC